MIRRVLRLAFRLGLAGGAGFAAVKFVQARRSMNQGMPSGDTSIMPKRSESPLVAPDMLKGVALKRDEGGDADGDSAADADANGQTTTATTDMPVTTTAGIPAAPVEAPEDGGAWVVPDGTSCPPSHPVKAKLQSGIYHLPGMTAYERTTPDRCYVDEDAAQAEGLRKAKR